MTDTRRDELIPTPATAASSSSTTDDMFASMGLGSYVKKKEASSVATGLMAQQQQQSMPPVLQPPPTDPTKQLSLEEKKRIMQQGEAMKAAQPQQKDLTQSLMNKSMSQMSGSSQSDFGAFASPQPSLNNSSTQWGSFAQAAPAPAMVPMGQMRPQQQKTQSKPDYSAFDSLLSMPQQSSSVRQPMGMAATGGGMPMSGFQGMGGQMRLPQPQAQKQQQQAKPLNLQDINDLLG